MNAREVVYTISPSADSTVVLDIAKAGLMKNKKHLLFFEEFQGVLHFFPEAPEESHVSITIASTSMACRDKWLNPAQLSKVVNYARQAMNVAAFPSVTFTSTCVSAKPLRGYNVDGTLTVRGVSRPVRVNMVVREMSRGALQLDGDATFRLSDFGIRPPDTLFGLVRTHDEALVRVLLWGQLKEQDVL